MFQKYKEEFSNVSQESSSIIYCTFQDVFGLKQVCAYRNRPWSNVNKFCYIIFNECEEPRKESRFEIRNMNRNFNLNFCFGNHFSFQILWHWIEDGRIKHDNGFNVKYSWTFLLLAFCLLTFLNEIIYSRMLRKQIEFVAISACNCLHWLIRSTIYC